jgi:hypothetical protein
MGNGDKAEPNSIWGASLVQGVVGGAAFAGAISGVLSRYISLFWVAIIFVGIFLPATVAAVLLIERRRWKDLFNDRRRIRELSDGETIQKKFSELVGAATHIKFIGPLDKYKAELFIKWIRNAETHRHQHQVSIEIFNTDTNFYRDAETRELVKSLIDLDKQHRFFNSYHSFNYRSHSHLRVAGQNGHVRSMLIFDDRGPARHALLIRHSNWIPVPNLSQPNIFPINFLQQATNFVEIDRQFWRFTEPLKRGWIYPIFPPLNDPVRHAYREAVLDWFNTTAISLVGGLQGDVSVTWLIEDGSEDDAKAFEKWLKLIRDDQQLTIKRFLLVNRKRFIKEPTYQSIVERIWKTYLPSNSANRYTIFVVNSESLDPGLKKDIALIKVGAMEYAQDSESERIAGSNVEIMRIYFSRAEDNVKEFRDKFESLKSGSKEFATFPALKEALTTGLSW